MPSDSELKTTLERCFTRGIPLDPMPEPFPRNPNIAHAPVRTPNLTPDLEILAVQNALRYFPPETHAVLAPEFYQELQDYGHIYMYRFRPTEYTVKAYSIDMLPGRITEAKCLMVMLLNNLDHDIAQFPEELVCYGGNGSVLSSWGQFHLIMQYLTKLTERQTLVLNSGMPMGLFPAPSSAPRMVITNGMTVPRFSTIEDYDRMYALGVSQYGQMTAGSFMYIGPQGIVHGTTLVLMAAARKYLNPAAQQEAGARAPGAQADAAELLKGKIFLSSGLGGMSGAQPKAGVIAGAITVVAEVDVKALDKRYAQGWVQERIYSLDELVTRLLVAKRQQEVVSLGYLGNVVDVWERMAAEAGRVQRGELTRAESVVPDIGSDQTSLHNPYNGGYYPVGMTFAEAQELMSADPAAFREAVHASLRRQVDAINACAALGTRFFDYGNSMLLQAFRAKADIVAPALKQDPAALAALDESTVKFAFPSYVQEFMGENIFSLGFGPFRWVCCSGSPEDLQRTDAIAARVLESLLAQSREDAWSAVDEEAVWARQTRVGADGQLQTMSITSSIDAQLRDNLAWVKAAGANKLVVGSQARILYADGRARIAIALAFNEAIARGEIGPVVLSRDHHDVSGTDSPFRETSNVADGSQFTADMAVHNAIGDAMRGATVVALHNGGGTGWAMSINGGFALVLDGSPGAAEKAESMLFWDVHNGLNRRAFSGSACANYAIARAEQAEPRLQVTRATHVDPAHVKALIGRK